MSSEASVEEIWGPEVAAAGWTAVPHLLLDHQHRLDLSSTELVARLHLLRSISGSDGLSRPNVERVAAAMDLGEPSVLRSFEALETMGYVTRQGDAFDLTRLVERLRIER